MNTSSTSFDASYWQNRYKESDTPWEIGYADGVKRYESIFIIPTVDR